MLTGIIPAAEPGSSKITLTWTAPADNGGSSISNYTVLYKATTSGCPSSVTETGWTLTTATTAQATSGKEISSLTGGLTYRLCVMANNSIGSSNWVSVLGVPNT